MRHAPKPRNTRNGLKWRDGRPRWEPSPASRKLGLKGVDLKDVEGKWISERGEAIGHCDARQLWAQMIREAAQEGAAGAEAGSDLRMALEGLQQPQEPAQRLRRLLLQDLVDKAQALVSGQDAAAGVSVARAPRTVERLVEAYFEAVDGRGPPDVPRPKIKPGTRQAYAAQRAPFLARFAGRAVAGIKRQELIAWYEDLVKTASSIATANLRLGATSAFLAYAYDLEWIPVSPAVKLGIGKAHGRRVFWTMEEEAAFVPWCDANGYADVADAVAAGLWTGARIVDLCAADLQDLGEPTWRFVPIKTEDGGKEAMPAITAPVRARIDRRRAAAIDDPVRHFNATPFLWDPEAQRRHTTRSVWKRFVAAKAEALAAGAVPETLALKKQQDTRDTCITRLWLAGVEISRMWSWTGHAQEGIEEILKEHYIVLLEAGQVEMGQQLQAWAAKQGVAL